jgi:hypothetical protein
MLSVGLDKSLHTNFLASQYLWHLRKATAKREGRIAFRDQVRVNLQSYLLKARENMPRQPKTQPQKNDQRNNANLSQLE